MKKLISLTVAAMMVLPAFAMAMPMDDPCPEGDKVPIEIHHPGTKENFTVHHAKRTVKHHAKKKKAVKHKAMKHKAAPKKAAAPKADAPKAG